MANEEPAAATPARKEPNGAETPGVGGAPSRAGPGAASSGAPATALVILSTAVIAGAVGGALYLLYRFVAAFSLVLLPLAVGALAAMVFRPWFLAFRHRLRLPAWAALIAVYFSVGALAAGFLYVFGRLITAQLGDLLRQAPEAIAAAYRWIVAEAPGAVDFLENHPAGRRLRDLVLSRQDAILEGFARLGETVFAAGAGIVRGAAHLLAWAVLPLYFSYFLVAAPKRVESEVFLPFLKPRTRETVELLVRTFVRKLVTFFRAQLVVAALQGLLLAIGFTLIGLDYGFVIGLFLGFLTIIPYLGSVVGFLLSVPLALSQADGGLWLAALAAGVLAAVQLIEGWVLTPRIMGSQTGLHWMTIIVAVLFWSSALGGLTGALLAIPLTAFAEAAWEQVRKRHLAPAG